MAADAEHRLVRLTLRERHEPKILEAYEHLLQVLRPDFTGTATLTIEVKQGGVMRALVAHEKVFGG